MNAPLPLAPWPASPRHVLFVRMDNMGDVLMCTPAMQAVREAMPRTRLTLLTSPSGDRLAPHLDMIDGTLVHRASWVKPPSAWECDDEAALVRQLAEARIDVAVLFTTATQSALPAALLCRMAGIPYRIAYSRENPYALLSEWVREQDEIRAGMRHEVQRQLDLVARLGVPAPADLRLRFRVRDEDRREARSVLQRAGLHGDQPYVLLHPGATAASRRYPPAAFAEVLKRLSLAGWTCVICGGGEDREAIAQIRAVVGSGAIDLGGMLSLGGLGALIEGAALMICNNSGPAHIAAALRTPQVCLYALTNPQHTPWQTPSRVLYQDVPCRDCLRSICPQGHNACLREVSPATVTEAAFGLLAHEPQPRAYSTL
jgi:lipopolysaccharide heptosyltransferase II